MSPSDYVAYITDPLDGCTVNGWRRSELPAIKPSQRFTSNAFHEIKTLTSSDCLWMEDEATLISR